MSDATASTAGVLFVVLPTVMYGGVSLLRLIQKRDPGYVDNPVRQNLWRAGHAHAGVLLVLALVAMRYMDDAGLDTGMETLARTCLVAAPILMPLGFFLSVASPHATRPNGLISLTYVGAAALAVGTVTIGVGLLTG
jgi:hypothetical protein